MPENNQILSVEGQLVGMPLAGPESFSQQQLDYLKRALGVDETVLWDRGAGAAVTSMTLSENAENFTKLKILAGNQWSEVTVTNGTCYVVVNSGGNYSTFGQIKCSVSGTSFSASKSMVWSINYNSTSGTFVNNNSDVNGSILKIVGVGRIAGGN